jgi:hypothetical protein
VELWDGYAIKPKRGLPMNHLSSRERDAFLRQSDQELLAQSRIERCRGSGRVGQKRNVTDSAVRLTHQPTGVVAESDATRSQNRNRTVALRALRMRIALHCRAEPTPEPLGQPPPSRKSDEYHVWAARTLDRLQAAGWRLSDMAPPSGLRTGRLVKLLAADRDLWQAVGEGRRTAGLKPLRPPR